MGSLITVRRSLKDYPAPTPQPIPCRLWQGRADADGYGRRGDGERQHRWVWRLAHGPIPPGMFVCHRCDQPLCYRLVHLFLGAVADNHADMVSKGRASGPKGARHPRTHLTADDVVEIRRLHATGLTPAAIGTLYGVHRTTIGDIVNRVTWRDTE